MRVAPNAQIDDGVFDWVIVPEMSRFSLLGKFPLLYSGSHIRDPQILQGQGRVIEACGVAGRARLDVDGESLGVLPARFEIIPEAITLIGFDE